MFGFSLADSIVLTAGMLYCGSILSNCRYHHCLIFLLKRLFILRAIHLEYVFGLAFIHWFLEFLHTTLFASTDLPTNQLSFEPVNKLTNLSDQFKPAFDEATICSC